MIRLIGAVRVRKSKFCGGERITEPSCNAEERKQGDRGGVTVGGGN